jgi:hypothetical protein
MRLKLAGVGIAELAVSKTELQQLLGNALQLVMWGLCFAAT